MDYPKEILPQSKYKKIEENLDSFFVCRKVLDMSVLDDIDDIIPEEILGLVTASDAFDYSTNLFGIFRLEHNQIQLDGPNKKQLRSYWVIGTEVEVPIYLTDFFINSNIGHFFLSIGGINKLRTPFSRTKNVTEYAQACVVHTPTNSNFWHFSIKWIDEQGQHISTTNSKWKDEIIITMRSALSQLFKIDCDQPSINEIKISA